jgi:flagellar basal body P-ring formation protein FlgA
VERSAASATRLRRITSGLHVALAALALLAAPAAGQGAEHGKGTVPVAARALPRGAVLAPQDILYPPSSDVAPAAASTVSAVSPGWVTRRTIAEGEPLRPPAVSPPALVAVGAPVQLVWRDGPVELRLAGRALNAAAAGERVTVQVDGKRRFEGVAVAAGVVRLDHTSRNR